MFSKTGPWGLEDVYRAINVRGLADLISASMDAGVQRIVHTSSITVYGHHLHGIISEDQPFHAEDNPYSRTKIAGEKLIANLVKDRGAPVVIVRPAWIYGPRDTASFGRFVFLVESGKGFLIGSGKNIVPVVYVRDVAQGLIKAGDAGDSVVGQAYTHCGRPACDAGRILEYYCGLLTGISCLTTCPLFALYNGERAAQLHGMRWDGVNPRLHP